jgi:nucleoside-diphosphate-sugar epimerase
MTPHTLVFGASGYLGRHLVGRLSDAGHQVGGVVRSASAGEVVAAYGGKPIEASLDDDTFLARAVSEADTLIWAAQLMLAEEQTFIERLLAQLAGTGKTFLFTGGTSLLSEFTGGDWSEKTFAEDDPFIPRRQIAARLDTERRVRAASGPGLRTICIRPPLIWGATPIKTICDLYHSSRLTGAVCVIGSGLGCYSTVHVADLADLYLLAIERGVGGALYHAVSGEISFRHMADTVSRHLGVTTRGINMEEAEALWDRFTARIVFGSCSRSRSPRARRELGWEPRSSRLDILAECVAPHYAEAGERALSSWVARAR